MYKFSLGGNAKWPKDPVAMSQKEAKAFARSVRIMTKEGINLFARSRAVFLMKSDNYKVVMSVGRSLRTMKRRAVLVDTGAGQNFIREDALPDGAKFRAKVGDDIRVFDANGKPLEIKGVTTLYVQVGNGRVKAEFLVCRSLLAPILVGTSFAKQHVSAIRPISGTLQMNNGDEVPLL